MAILLGVVAGVAIAVVVLFLGREQVDFELLPVNPGGPIGVAHLEQDGDRLRGRLVVWGLGPGSRHLAHLSGPSAACRPQVRQVRRRALVLPELVADPNGVAFARLDVRVSEDVVEPGYYLMVYSGPRSAAGNARVACGDLVGGGPIAPAALATAGPGAGARTQTSTIVQLRDGRPIGGPQQIAARPGDRVALAVRSDLPDEIRLGGLGLTQQVGPGTIARFSLVAPRPGRYPLRARTGGS
ncbi:MAG: hypothetical protein H0U12_03120, partial [Thermoleophilaceae bacterium]|nr:hypothetical protein [Thermoleophilaceae bacterium]